MFFRVFQKEAARASILGVGSFRVSMATLCTDVRSICMLQLVARLGASTQSLEAFFKF